MVGELMARRTIHISGDLFSDCLALLRAVGVMIVSASYHRDADVWHVEVEADALSEGNEPLSMVVRQERGNGLMSATISLQG